MPLLSGKRRITKVDYAVCLYGWFEPLPSSIVCVKLKIHDVFFGGLLPNA